MHPELKLGISDDLPDTLKTKYSLVRKDFQRSPDNKAIKPSFAFNEFSFYGNKEVFDYASAKPTSTFDMLNVYRLDLKLKSPFFKEYKKTLDHGGFGKTRGMCATIVELNSVGRSPNKDSLKQNKKYKSLPPISLPCSPKKPLHLRASPPLLKPLADVLFKPIKPREKVRTTSEVDEMRMSIDEFEKSLKNSMMEEVQTQYFVRNYKYQ